MRWSRRWDGRDNTEAFPFIPQSARQINRRRASVFLSTLVVALAVSLGYALLRPPEYRASARIEITPASGPSPSAALPRRSASSGEATAKPFLTEVQVLTSRPVLEAAAARLARTGLRLSDNSDDPIADVQSRLEANTVSDTNVVELVATGFKPELLAPLLNAIVDVYRDRLAADYRSSSDESTAQAREEVQKLEARVAAKRRDVEAFRLRHGIVSLQRDENELLSRVRNLSNSLSAANDRVAAADGKLRSLKESAAAGQAVVRSRDDPTLANIEQRASQAREELRELERGYTPGYLAKDSRATSLRTRIAELDQQAKLQREAGQQATLLEAQQELTGAQEAARRLQNQIASGRQEVGQFTSRFNEYTSQQGELVELEATLRDAVQRQAKLEASERARMPSMRILEGATTPSQAWRPLYGRDAALSVVASIVLALLAMWLVELFNRSDPQPAMVVVNAHPAALPLEAEPRALLPQDVPFLALPGSAPALLPKPLTLPREITRAEAESLVRAADDEGRLAMLLLLSGLSPEELIGLRSSDVDLARPSIRVGGESTREVVPSGGLREALAARLETAGPDLLLTVQGRPATPDGIDAQILCAAHDASLERPTEITSACLRHTYVAYLVRQGIRFRDLARIVGTLAPEALGAYSALSPAGVRLSREAIDAVHPAVRLRESG